MIGKALVLALWACGTAIVGLHLGVSADEEQVDHATTPQQYRQMPLVALPVISERRLLGLLFLKAGLSWKSSFPALSHETVISLFHDSAIDAGFAHMLKPGFDIAQLNEDTFASDIKARLAQSPASMNEPDVILLKLEFYQQSALRSAGAAVDAKATKR